MKRIELKDGEISSLQQAGISLYGAQYLLDDKDPWKQNIGMAMDALPGLVTAANSGIPTYLTTVLSGKIVDILTAKNAAADIIGEQKFGTLEQQQLMFTIVEPTVQVSAYGDYNNNGISGLNTEFPQRQSFNSQVIVNYGFLEEKRAGLAKIDWANRLQLAAVAGLDKQMNFMYFFGVQGLQNYGLLNDPLLPPAITPATKAAGGVAWIDGAGVVKATANEVVTDLQAGVASLVRRSNGTIDMTSPITIGMSPSSSVALQTTNSFGLTAMQMLKNAFPNVKIKTAAQYGAITASNPQGNAAGELVQFIATEVHGQETAFGAFSEKLQTFPLVPDVSSWKQKYANGGWGAVILQPFAVSALVGV